MKNFPILLAAVLVLSCPVLRAGTNDSPADHFKNGVAAFLKKDFALSASEFVATLKSDEVNFQAYYYLGLSYRNLKEYDRALFTLRRLLELNERDAALTAETYTEMARIYNLSGSPREAVNILLHALKLGFKTTSILNELAKSYLYLRNFRNSKKALDISLSIEPDNAFTYNLLGSLYLEVNRPAQAETSFETAVAFKPEIPLFYANLALSLERQQRFDEALKNFKKAAELSPATQEFTAGVNRVQKLARKK